MSSVLKRVKVYKLSRESGNEQWVDNGTGYVSVVEDHIPKIVVNSEIDDREILVSRILLEISFSKEDGTLILWLDEDGQDYALSFQEKDCCDAFHREITLSKERFQETSSEEDGERSVKSSAEDLGEVIQMLVSGARIVDIENFFPSLMQQYEKYRQSHNHVQLENIYNLVKKLIHSDRREYFDVMLSPRFIDLVICILNAEDDGSRFKQVGDIDDPQLCRNLGIVFKTLYIRDISYNPQTVLERETICLGLSSFLADRVEETLRLFENSPFLRAFFDEIAANPSRSDMLVFVRQLVRLTDVISSWPHYCHILLEAGLIKAIHAVLKCGESTRTAVTILLQLIDKSPNVIRDCLHDKTEMIDVLVHIIIHDSDPELKTAYEILTAIRQILDSDMLSEDPKLPSRLQFVDVHFNDCLPRIIEPIFAVTDDSLLVRDDRKTADYLVLILDHLTPLVPNYANQLHPLNIDRGLLFRVVALFSSRYKLLVLSALRYFKEILLYRPSYVQHVTSRKLFDHVVPLLSSCGRRYNMINSAVLELFENCYESESIDLANHIISEYYDLHLSSIRYVKTFAKMKARIEWVGKASFSYDDSCDYYKEGRDDEEDNSRDSADLVDSIDFERELEAIVQLRREKLMEQDFPPVKKPGPILIVAPTSLESSLKRGLVDYESDSDDEDVPLDPDITSPSKRKCVD